jgi:hypothetical protein
MGDAGLAISFGAGLAGLMAALGNPFCRELAPMTGWLLGYHRARPRFRHARCEPHDLPSAGQLRPAELRAASATR